jgi:hypothetical protein
VMAGMEAGSVDAVVTSPPYGVDKEYEADIDEAGHVVLLRGFVREAARLLDGGRFLFLNLDDPIVGNIRPALPPVLDAATAAGLDYFDRRIWKKDPCWKTCQWHPSSLKSVSEFEPLYIFRKRGVGRDLRRMTAALAAARDAAGWTDGDIDRVLGTNGFGKKLTDHGAHARVPSPRVWATLRAHLPIPDDCESLYRRLRRPARDRLSPAEWAKWGSRGVWDIPSVRANDHHPAAFPLELARRAVRLLTDEGDLVLDPFAGTGTTLMACIKAGRRAIGIEVDARYCEGARRRLRDAETPLFAGL